MSNHKIKLILFILIVFLFVPEFVQSTNFDFSRDDGTSGTTFHVGYEKSSNSIANNVLKNKNLICPITCTYTTSQGLTGDIPGNDNGYIGAGGESPSFAIPVVAEGEKILRNTVTCHDKDTALCSPDDSNEVSKDISLSWDYCGDGTKNGPESCDGGSQSCSSINSKYHTSDSAVCKSDCSGYDISNCEYCGDGEVNGVEECDTNNFNGKTCSSLGYFKGTLTCDNNCKISSSECNNCGNGIVDSGENCKTCQADAKCQSGLYCSDSGSCVQCTLDAHCDNKGTFSRGDSKCSVDYKKVIQKGVKTYEKCVNYKCSVTTESVDETLDCNTQGVFCQDGNCGCSEGYEACKTLGRCVKIGESGLNDPCKCNFQCESNYCRSDKCMDGLVIDFKSSDTMLKKGEETSVSLDVSNPFNENIFADILISIGSGGSISGVLGGEHCSGSQCKTRVEIPGNSRKDLTIKLQANDLGIIDLQGKVTYKLGNEEFAANKELQIKVTETGEEEKEVKESTGFIAKLLAWIKTFF